MSDRRTLTLLSVVLTLIVVAVGSLAIVTLYDAQINARERELLQAARLQADVLQSEPALLQSGRSHPSSEQAIVIYRMLGEHGTIVLARLAGDTVVYVGSPWLPNHRQLGPTSIYAEQAAPMLRALAGETGTMVTVEESGSPVIAAFAPVPSLGLGVVARTDLTALRKPFIYSAAAVGATGLALVLMDCVLYLAVARPILRRRRESEDRFRGVFDNMCTGAAVFRAVGSQPHVISEQDDPTCAEMPGEIHRLISTVATGPQSEG